MSDLPRKHHYVPRFYLAGFTETVADNGKLHVLDTVLRKTWISSPKEAAHRRDFHKVDLGRDFDPMAVEKALGRFENRWATVLQSVVAQRSLPTDDSFGDLMVFIAFMAVRVPVIREKITDWFEEVRRKEDFARKWLEDQGIEVATASETDFGEFNQTWHVQQLVRMASELAPRLALRHWNLWIAEEHAPDLLCSDSPVAPTWATATVGPNSPAFGTPNTSVSIPLNRRLAMVSMLETDLGSRALDRTGVARINSATGMYAQQLYSSEPDFVWLMESGKIGTASELLQALEC